MAAAGLDGKDFRSVPSGARRLAELIPGLEKLWTETKGDPRVVVAVLDGPVDLRHRALDRARLACVESDVEESGGHGTLIATTIFGSHQSETPGLAPDCRGLVVPVFEKSAKGGLAPCTLWELARAISAATAAGANIINISGGISTPTPQTDSILDRAIREAISKGVLIVAAAGNEGCDCLHAPAAHPMVLAVGAMDRTGRPLASSNFGNAYKRNGLLALGSGLAGRDAMGTSIAAAVVSGAAALLWSLELRQGRKTDGARIRSALLQSVDPCRDAEDVCRRWLAGRLNLTRAQARLNGSRIFMSADVVLNSVGETTIDGLANGSVAEPSIRPSLRETPLVSVGVAPSACGCTAVPDRFVFALGQIGVDFGSEARRDSLQQNMEGDAPNPNDMEQLLAYFDANPWEAKSVQWTLAVDATPIYAIAPTGPFAADAFAVLRRFLSERVAAGVEMCSIAGTISGKTTLLSGQSVPTIAPEIRGMGNWNVRDLASAAGKGKKKEEANVVGVTNFLERVYFELRNLGASPQERAINFAAANAFQIEQVFEKAYKENLELDSIDVERSPLCRPESDCWDVKLHFFYPERQVQTVRRVYRFTVDVSDVVPVTVGPMRSWFVR